MSEQKASIGRIVHFYKPAQNSTAAAGPEGPFAAMVTNVRDAEGQFVNVVCFEHFGAKPLYEGSVYHKGHPNQDFDRYWEFPPRV
jgi:hypothetical protein